MTRARRVPAMVNAHSHAFQRDLRGIAERPGAPDDDFWSLAHGDVPPRGRARARHRCATSPAACTREMARGRLRRRRRVPLRPPPPGRHAVRDPNAMAIAVAEAAVAPACGSSCCPPPTTATAGTARDRPPQPGQRRFCDPDVDDVPAPRGRPARLGRGPRRRHGRPRRPQRPRRPGGLARGDRRPRRASTTSCCHVHAHEQRRELARVRRRARLHADRAARAHRLPRRAHERRPRHPRDRRRHRPPRAVGLDRRVLPDDRGQPRRRLPPRAALPRRGRARWRSAATRRSGVDPFEEVRELETGARREGQTRHALLAATRRPVGRARRQRLRGARPRPTRARSRSTSTIPTCAGSPRRTCRTRWRRARRPASSRAPRSIRRRMSPADRLAARTLELIDVPVRVARRGSARRARPRRPARGRRRRAATPATPASSPARPRAASARSSCSPAISTPSPRRTTAPGRRDGRHVHGLGAADMKGARRRDDRARARRAGRPGERRRRLRLLRPRGAAVRRQRAEPPARARARPAHRRRRHRHGADRQRDPRRLPGQHQRALDVPGHQRPLGPPVVRRQRDPPRRGRHRRAGAGPRRAARVRRAALHAGRLGHARSRAGSPTTSSPTRRPRT